MLAMFDRIKSIFFPVNSHKRKSTDPLDTLNENNSFYENSSKTKLKLNNENQNHTRELTVYDSIFKPNNRSSTVFKDNSSVVLNCNIKKIRVDNCQITQYVHNDCKSPNNKISRIDSVDFKSNESKYINNNNNKKISDFQSNPELTALTVKSKSHLLSSNFISNLTKPSIHSDSRQRRLQRLQIESSVNNEEIKKYDGSYIEDITDYFRELCYIPPLVFPRLSKKVVLPKITDEMRNMVNCSIVNRNRDMVVVEEFNLSITVTDLISLQPRQWLTDNIINFYLELIYFRNNSNNQYPSVQILTTFFYPKLRSSGYSGVKRWTKKRPVFDSQLVLIPIHLGNHWCLVSIDMCNQEVHYYDSLKGRNPECLELMKEFLVEDSKDKLKKQISISEWTFKQIYDGPTQHNGYDCGVFLSQTAEYLSRRSKLDFNQDQMQYFREKMSFEILNKQLL